MNRRIRIHSITPVHPGRGEPSRIVAYIELTYLKGQPLEMVELTEGDALLLAEQALVAARILRGGTR